MNTQICKIYKIIKIYIVYETVCNLPSPYFYILSFFEREILKSTWKVFNLPITIIKWILQRFNTITMKPLTTTSALQHLYVPCTICATVTVDIFFIFPVLFVPCQFCYLCKKKLLVPYSADTKEQQIHHKAVSSILQMYIQLLLLHSILFPAYQLNSCDHWNG